MKKLLKVIFLASTLTVTAQTNLLTNADVIEMSNATLPISVIKTKINTSETNFDVSVEGLKQLNSAKVPEEIITLMIQKGIKPTTPESKEVVKENRQEGAASLQPSNAQTENSKEISQTKSITTSNYTSLPDPNFSKESEKQRFKRPAEIGIGSSRERTEQILINAFQGWDYQLDSNQNGQLIFSKPVSGFGNQLLVGMATGDSNARYQIHATLTEYDYTTNVTINMSVRSQNAFGRVNTNSLNSNKKTRRQLDNLLLEVKRKAENY